MSSNPFRFGMAVEDFQAARQRAALQEILARFTGRSNELLSYDDVAAKLKLRISTDRGLRQIPLDAIVGSVGRYAEFTRSFLPRRMEDRERWARVKAAMDAGVNMPPIELFQVGEAYFVVDGNHRVSIARQEGLESIEAHVIEYRTDIPITPETQVDDLLIKAEYAEFSATTRLNQARPNVDLSVTSCCQYDKLLEQIRLAQQALQEQAREAGAGPESVSLQEAAAAWYDTTYIPLAEAIRDRGLLRGFPGRTITDLYIWIAENRAALEEELGWQLQSEAAATDLLLERSARTESGSWRKARTVARYTDRLFVDILVPLSGEVGSWDSLAQAISIARREGARLHGLHIVDSSGKTDEAPALEIQQRFQARCAEAGVDGTLAIEAGDVTRKISERAAMTDLVVLKLAHPPAAGLGSFRSPYRSIIASSSRPVLAVPGAATGMQRALLAYDGSELAREALFVAAYLAEVWKTQLMVLTALEGRKVNAGVQDYVRRYLELHEVSAEYIVAAQPPTDCLQQTAEEREADLVLMGSHGGSVLRQVLIGSALDHMLRESKVPIFICR